MGNKFFDPTALGAPTKPEDLDKILKPLALSAAGHILETMDRMGVTGRPKSEIAFLLIARSFCDHALTDYLSAFETKVVNEGAIVASLRRIFDALRAEVENTKADGPSRAGG